MITLKLALTLLSTSALSSGVIYPFAAAAATFSLRIPAGSSYESLPIEKINRIPNSSCVGAIVGTPGVAPTGWVIGSSSGVNATIVGKGVANGIGYVDVRWSGVATATGAIFNDFGSLNGAAGTAYAAALTVQIVGGSLAGLTGWVLRMGAGETGQLNPTFTGVSTKYAFTHFLQTSSLTLTLRFNPIAISSAVNLTLRFSAPQINYGPVLADYIATNNTPAYYGELVRVRRSSDNLEANIPALEMMDANGDRWLNQIALLDFVAPPLLTTRLNDGAWTAQNQTVTAPVGAMLGGSQRYDLTAPTTGTAFRTLLRALTKTTTSQQYRFSLDVAPSSTSHIYLRLDANTVGVWATFNTATGVLTETGTSGAPWAINSTTSVPLPDGGYRISVLFTTGLETSVRPVILPSNTAVFGSLGTPTTNCVAGDVVLRIANVRLMAVVNAFVARTYDQSGANQNLSQTNSGLQPRIVNGSVVENINGRPSIFYSGGQTLTGASVVTARAASSVAVPTAGSLPQVQYGAGGNNITAFLLAGSVRRTGLADVNTTMSEFNDTPPNLGTPRVYFDQSDTNSIESCFRNNVALPLGVSSSVETFPNVLTIGSRLLNNGAGTPAYYTGHLPELVLFPYAISANHRAVLIQNTMAAYGIAVA